MDKNSAIVAKLECGNKSPIDGEETVEVDFFPADTTFASRLNLYGVSKQVADRFEIGKEYYLTIMPIEIIGKEIKNIV